LLVNSIVYLPHLAIRDILLQHDTKGRRGNWIAKVEEYDLKLKPIKIMKGQGFPKLLTKSNLDALSIDQYSLRTLTEENEEK